MSHESTPRIQTLDILRGFALLGMIIVHFHQRFRQSAEGMSLYAGEELVGWAVWMGIEGKSWGLFALLFGAGFAILLRRADTRGEPIGAFYLRRLAILALMGFAVEWLTGFNVLLEYAIWGVPLLFVRHWSTRSLLALAVMTAAAWWLVALGTGAYALWAGTATEAAAPVATVTPQSYGDVLRIRLANMQQTYLGWRVLIPTVSFSFFLFGMLAIRHRIFDDPLKQRSVIIGAATIGLASWLSYWFVLPLMPTDAAAAQVVTPFRYGLGIVREQWLTFTYAGVLTLLLAYRPVWTARLELIGAAGRMPLTNYVVQAAFVEWLASPFGAALRLRPYAYVAGAFLLFVVLALLSRVWLARARYGPLEWGWRRLSYV